VLVVVEYATRFAWVIPYKADPTAEEVLFYLTFFIFAVIGWPRELITDNGGNMMAKVIATACAKHGCTKRESSIYNPSGNGRAENMVKQTITMLRKLGSNYPEEWDRMLPGALQCWNATPSAREMSPFRALLGIDVQPQLVRGLPLVDLVQRHHFSEADREAVSEQDLSRRQGQAVRSNRLRREPTIDYQPGQLVWARYFSRPVGVAGKLEPDFHEPFTVLTTLKHNMVYGRHLGSSTREIYLQIFHVTPMFDTDGDKIFIPVTQAKRAEERMREGAKDTSNDEQFIVEAIVDHGWTESGRLAFEVSWRGYPNDNTWEDEGRLECQREVFRYFKSRARVHNGRAPML
jgi:hypothetical protein